MSVEIANESGAAVDEVALAAVARYVLDELHIHPLAELSVLLVDEQVMADLHQRWMGEPGPADVLAFPMDELRPPGPPYSAGARGDSRTPDGAEASPALLGDVVLCPQVAAEQAREAQHSVGDELELLCTHGLLHLLGYDHADDDERATMFGLQDRLLASWRAARRATSHATGHPAESRGNGGSSESGGKGGSAESGGSGPEGRKGPG
jgi:probable rRNA maturation factor